MNERFIGKHPALAAPYGKQKETWFCAVCLGEISHDAIAVYNPTKEDYDVLGLLDGMWCETCGEDQGEPTFGVPPKED